MILTSEGNYYRLETKASLPEKLTKKYEMVIVSDYAEYKPDASNIYLIPRYFDLYEAMTYVFNNER